MSMDRSFPQVDVQPKGSAGTGSQTAMPFLSVVPAAQLLLAHVLASATFNGCLIEAARHSGLDDQEIADQIHICHGYMSRFMRGVGQQWAKRLVAFMRVTNSLAPLQWMAREMAREMGCDLVLRDAQAARIAELQAELLQLQRGAA